MAGRTQNLGNRAINNKQVLHKIGGIRVICYKRQQQSNKLTPLAFLDVTVTT